LSHDFTNHCVNKIYFYPKALSLKLKRYRYILNRLEGNTTMDIIKQAIENIAKSRENDIGPEYTKKNQTEDEGLIYVRQEVNKHGSIFRTIDQHDIGIDGVIELVDKTKSSGLLLAVQVKSGDSYVASNGDKFIMHVDETHVKKAHVKYWQSFMLPVVLIGYSPSRGFAAWVPIKEYTQHQLELGKVDINSIEIPFINKFDSQALSGDLRKLALTHDDERFLFKSANMCLSSIASDRRGGIIRLWLHPSSQRTQLTALLASQLILDENLDVVRFAASALGSCIGREGFLNMDVISRYAVGFCLKFNERHVRRLMEAVDDGYFGPNSLGESCLICISPMWAPNAENALHRIAEDKQLSMQTRANALFVLYGCDRDKLVADSKLLHDIGLEDLIDWMMATRHHPT
jgi:hypothetical protein